MEAPFSAHLERMPVIAVLRHLGHKQAVAVGKALIGSGIEMMEVPLNGQGALATLETLVKNFKKKALIGAGTVLTAQDVRKVADCGAQFMLAPNVDPEVIAEARHRDLPCVPGVATPSEAFMALKLGAAALKLFPGDMLSPAIVRSFRIVLPPKALVLVSGGVNATNIKSYLDAGANGFALGSAVFKPHFTPEEVGTKSRQIAGLFNKEF